MCKPAPSQVLQHQEPVRIFLMNEMIRLADVSEAFFSDQRIENRELASIFVSGFKIAERDRALGRISAEILDCAPVGEIEKLHRMSALRR